MLTLNKEAPGGEPSASEELCQQENTARLPEPSIDELIVSELHRLAESEPTELKEDGELRRLADQNDRSRKTLKNTYKAIKAACFDEKHKKAVQDVPPPSAEQTAKREAADHANEAKRKRTASKVQWLQHQADLHPIFRDQLRQAGYIGPTLIVSSILLSHSARLLPTTTAFFFYGASSSGKSDGLKKAAQFLPEGLVVPITSMSKTSLCYLGTITGKYLEIGEIFPAVDGEDDFVQQTMRQLISENRTTRLITDRPDGKTLTSVTVETQGPAVIVATTTKAPSKFNDELQNRATWIASDDSEETTKDVLDFIAEAAIDPTKATDPAHLEMVEAFREFHLTLQALPVTVPFAHRIKPSPKHVTARRLSKIILNYTCANALLHQHTRAKEMRNGIEHVVATKADYAIAYAVAAASAPRVLEDCSQKAREVFDSIIEPAFLALPEGKTLLTTNKIKTLCGQNRSTLDNWLRDYVKLGLLDLVDFKDGRQNQYALAKDRAHFRQDLGLVPPEQIVDAAIDWSKV